MDNLNKPLLLLDNDAEYELIVPHHLLTNSNFQIEILKTHSIKTIDKFGIQMKTIKKDKLIGCIVILHVLIYF